MPVQIPHRAAALVSSLTGTPGSANPVVFTELFVHGRAEGPIQMTVEVRATTTAPISTKLGAR